MQWISSFFYPPCTSTKNEKAGSCCIPLLYTIGSCRHLSCTHVPGVCVCVVLFPPLVSWGLMRLTRSVASVVGSTQTLVVRTNGRQSWSDRCGTWGTLTHNCAYTNIYTSAAQKFVPPPATPISSYFRKSFRHSIRLTLRYIPVGGKGPLSVESSTHKPQCALINLSKTREERCQDKGGPDNKICLS